MTAAFQPGDIPADFQLSLLSSPQIESPIILRPYLQINPAANWQSIKANYTELTRLYHPESTSLDEATAEEMMNRLNWALELAKLHSEGQLEFFDKIEKAD